MRFYNILFYPILCVICLAAPLASAKAKVVTPAPKAVTPPNSTQSLQQYVYALPAAVQQIHALCPWRSKQGKGVVRVIHSQQHNQNQLFLQWVQSATKEQPNRIISSVAVHELNQKNYRFALPKASVGKHSCTLTGKAIQQQGQRPYRIYLKLTGFGQYQLSLHEIFADAP